MSPESADGKERLGALSEIADKLARLLEHRSVEPIEKHGRGAGIHLGGKFFQNLTRLKGTKIDQADCKLCLPREVEAEIGFVHWRGRVMRHGWVAVDAIDLLSGGGEELAEDQKSPKMRRSHHNWNGICGEYSTAHLKRAPDIAAMRRGVEGGADFVLNRLRSQLAHAGKDRRQMYGHPLRRAGPRIAGKTNRLAMREAGQLRGLRLRQEENARNSVDSELFEYIGRTREVVAVVAVEQ